MNIYIKILNCLTFSYYDVESSSGVLYQGDYRVNPRVIRAGHLGTIDTLNIFNRASTREIIILTEKVCSWHPQKQANIIYTS